MPEALSQAAECCKSESLFPAVNFDKTLLSIPTSLRKKKCSNSPIPINGTGFKKRKKIPGLFYLHVQDGVKIP